jgi:glycosyltransferase involved in cell wall biosynthesis
VNVLYICNFQGPGVTATRRLRRNRALGGSRKIELLASALYDRGHSVTILSAGTPAERSGRWYGRLSESLAVRTNGSEPPVVYYEPAVDLPIANRLISAVALGHSVLRNSSKFDVAIVYNLAPEAVGAASLGQLRRLPWVLEYEDDACASLKRGRNQSWSGRALVGIARRNAAGMIAVNQELLSRVGIPNGTVVYGIVADESFCWPQRSYDSRAEPFRLVYAGSLTTAKGVDLLVEAAALLGPSVQLTVFGTGPEESRLTELVRPYPHIAIRGEVSREVLETSLSHAHVCVNPHRVQDGQQETLFPFKIAEYLAAGAVVVSSPLSALPRDVENGIAFYTNQSASGIVDAIERVKSDYATWSARSAAARQAVRSLVSEQAVGERVERILVNATAGR